MNDVEQECIILNSVWQMIDDVDKYRRSVLL